MKRFKLLLALGCMALGAMSAHAAATMDFSNGAVQQGSVTFNGTKLIGSNIYIDDLSVFNAPQNSGNYDADAILTFESGNCIVCSGTLTFATGGFLTINGSVAGVVSNVDLLSATGIDIFQFVSIGSPVFLDITIPIGTDTKDPTLVSYFFGNQPVSFAFGGTINYSTATNVVTSADITNTATVIPEPTSLLLLGTGMIGAAFVMHRRRKNSKTS